MSGRDIILMKNVVGSAITARIGAMRWIASRRGRGQRKWYCARPFSIVSARITAAPRRAARVRRGPLAIASEKPIALPVFWRNSRLSKPEEQRRGNDAQDRPCQRFAGQAVTIGAQTTHRSRDRRQPRGRAMAEQQREYQRQHAADGEQRSRRRRVDCAIEGHQPAPRGEEVERVARPLREPDGADGAWLGVHNSRSSSFADNSEVMSVTSVCSCSTSLKVSARRRSCAVSCATISARVSRMSRSFARTSPRRSSGRFGRRASCGVDETVDIGERALPFAHGDEIHARAGQFGLQFGELPFEQRYRFQLALFGKQDQADRFTHAADADALVGVFQRLLGFLARGVEFLFLRAQIGQSRDGLRELVDQRDVGVRGVGEHARVRPESARLAA